MIPSGMRLFPGLRILRECQGSRFQRVIPEVFSHSYAWMEGDLGPHLSRCAGKIPWLQIPNPWAPTPPFPVLPTLKESLKSLWIHKELLHPRAAPRFLLKPKEKSGKILRKFPGKFPWFLRPEIYNSHHFSHFSLSHIGARVEFVSHKSLSLG